MRLLDCAVGVALLESRQGPLLKCGEKRREKVSVPSCRGTVHERVHQLVLRVGLGLGVHEPVHKSLGLELGLGLLVKHVIET